MTSNLNVLRPAIEMTGATLALDMRLMLALSQVCNICTLDMISENGCWPFSPVKYFFLPFVRLIYVIIYLKPNSFPALCFRVEMVSLPAMAQVGLYPVTTSQPALILFPNATYILLHWKQMIFLDATNWFIYQQKHFFSFMARVALQLLYLFRHLLTLTVVLLFPTIFLDLKAL